MKDNAIAVRIDKSTRKRIERLARARLDGIVVTMSQVARAAISAGLDELERQMRQKVKA